ncbi:hypothetical protein [Nocardioides psychrotolerans]|uniref:hypothetical protein n=1 Tax=Nocardioides psychrotolerans TaxID=1005945 RepID=UPI000B8232E5|nr:hypothetical protein [Nocardioides psychrotolerans]
MHHLESPAEVRVLLRSLGIPATAAGSPEWTPATASAIDAHGGPKALAARLSLEYNGAVSGREVEQLVRRVTRELRRGHVSTGRLLDVAEAQCRRELTDRLARGVPTSRASA